MLVAAVAMLGLVPPGVPDTAALSGRRALLQRSAAAAAALSFVPMQAMAGDMMDLSAPDEAASTAGPIKMQMVSAGEKAAKKDTPASRLKELIAKEKSGGLSDKEKKEMRVLKAEEMCELLGRGC